MDDARGVGPGQRVGDGDRDPQHLAEPHALARDERVERLTLDVLHDHEVDAVRRLDLVDGDDVGMVEGGGRPRLLDEAPARFSSAIRSAGRTLIATVRPRRVSRAR